MVSSEAGPCALSEAESLAGVVQVLVLELSVKVSVEGVELPKKEAVKYLGWYIVDRAGSSTLMRCGRGALLASLQSEELELISLLKLERCINPSYRPICCYCCVVWNSCVTGLSDRLEWVQNYAMHMKPPRTCSEEHSP